MPTCALELLVVVPNLLRPTGLTLKTPMRTTRNALGMHPNGWGCTHPLLLLLVVLCPNNGNEMMRLLHQQIDLPPPVPLKLTWMRLLGKRS